MPKFICSHFMGVMANYGVGLKLAQAWGCPCPMPMLYKMSVLRQVSSHPFQTWGCFKPMLYKMSIQRHKVSSHPFQACGCPMHMLYKMSIQRHNHPCSPPAPCSPFSYSLFWKLADRCKCSQPRGEIFLTLPLSLGSGG